MGKARKAASKKEKSEVALDEPKVEDSTENQVEDEITPNEDTNSKKKGKAKKEEAPSQEEEAQDDEETEAKENGDVPTEKKKPAAEKKPKATKRAAPKPATEPARKSSRTPKPVAKENGEEDSFEVEQVVGVRVKNGNTEYKIRWKGYKASDDTWEPEKHLSCQDLIKAYLEEHKDEVENATKKSPAKKAKTTAKSPKSKKSRRK